MEFPSQCAKANETHLALFWFCNLKFSSRPTPIMVVQAQELFMTNIIRIQRCFQLSIHQILTSFSTLDSTKWMGKTCNIFILSSPLISTFNLLSIGT